MSDPQGKGLVLFSRESDVSQDVVVFIDLYSHKKKDKTGSVLSSFCHATFHHSLIRRAVMYSQRGTTAQVCLDQDTFDFMQGHVTKHQPNGSPC